MNSRRNLSKLLRPVRHLCVHQSSRGSSRISFYFVGHYVLRSLEVFSNLDPRRAGRRDSQIKHLNVEMKELSRTESIEFMLRQFKPERYAYLGVSMASFLLLLVCIVLFLLREDMTERNLGYIAGMVGSGGAIAYTASQLLRMWRDCLNLLMNSSEKGGERGTK